MQLTKNNMKLLDLFTFRTGNRTFYIIAALILLVVAAYLNRDSGQDTNVKNPSVSGFVDINPGELSRLMNKEEDLVIIDVRTPGEWRNGKVAEALTIDLNSPKFQDEIQALDSSATYLIYCNSGNRSRVASNFMIESGFTNVYNYNGRHTRIRQEYSEWMSEQR